MFPVKFGSIWLSGLKVEYFKMYQPIRNTKRPLRPCFFSDWDEMRKPYTGPFIDAPMKY